MLVFHPQTLTVWGGSRTTCAFSRIFCFVSMCESVQRGDNAALHGTCALCDIPTRFEPCQRYSKKRSIFLAPGADRILVPVGGLSAPSRGPGRIRTSSKNPSASSKMSKRRPRQHCHGGDYWKLFHVRGAIPSRRFQKDETVLFARRNTLDTTPFCKSHRQGLREVVTTCKSGHENNGKIRKKCFIIVGWCAQKQRKPTLHNTVLIFFPGQMTVLCCAPLPLLQTTGQIEFLAVAQRPF